MSVIYDKIAIIGVGLIGASIALGARRAGLAGHIVGCDADPAVAPEIESLRLVDSFTADAVEAVAEADLVIMAVPVGVLGDLAAQLGPGPAVGGLDTPHVELQHALGDGRSFV